MTEERDWEAEASKEGWTDKDNFNGDPDKWKSAEQFVKDGENILPILKSRLEKQEEVNKTLLDKMDATGKTVKELGEHYKKVVADTKIKAYEQALKDIAEKQREAVAEQDTEAFDRLEKERKDLQPPIKPEANTDTPPPEFEPWQNENPWYNSDFEMTEYANSVRDFVFKRTPGIRPAKFFEEITNEVKKRFPEKFEPPKKNQTVEGDTGTETKSSGKRTYKNLPADAKRICDDLVKQGHLTKEAYVEDYIWED